jgi:hypothetical protein
MDWQIRNLEKRLAEIEAKLAKSEPRESYQQDHGNHRNPAIEHRVPHRHFGVWVDRRMLS